MKNFKRVLVVFLVFLFAFQCIPMPNYSSPTIQTAYASDVSYDTTCTPFYPYDTSILTTEQKSGKIIMFDVNKDWNDDSSIIWSWHPSNSSNIPSGNNWFTLPTDCKPVLNGSHVIVTASYGGVALIRMSDKQAVFYANVGGNTHSGEILPDGNMVTASSDGYITIISVGSQFPSGITKTNYTLTGAHGVLWDSKRQILWALGTTQLKKYSYNFNKTTPGLTEVGNYKLTYSGGHDLYPVQNDPNKLFVSSTRVCTFDINTGMLSLYSPMRQGYLRSISQRLSDNTIAYTFAKTSWYTDTITLLNGTRKIRANAQFYKARWWTPNPFSYGQ